jgi:hypothetical protein
VPVAAGTGRVIEFGQWLNGDGFRPYEHSLFYAGLLDRTPARWAAPDSEGKFGPGHYVIEADPGGARYRKLSCAPQDYPGALWSTLAVRLNDAQRESVCFWMRHYLGTPYAWLDYGALAAHRLRLHPADNMLRKRIASTGHMICSQYIDQCLLKAGYHLFTDNRWPGFADPLALANLITSSREGV